jgi:serine protease AprX
MNILYPLLMLGFMGNNRQAKIDPEISKQTRLFRSDQQTVPVVVLYDKNHRCQISNVLRNYNIKIKYDLPIINGFAAEVPSNVVESLSKDINVNYISYDSEVSALMDISRKAVQADVINKSGFTGKGIGVAVVDTGIYPHSDLTKNQNRIIAFKDFVNNHTLPYDDEGHGTHVAGIIGGNGITSNERYQGIAPGANLIGVKVLNGSGSGNLSDVVAGIQWVVDNRNKYNIRVMNLSLGSKPSFFYFSDPIIRAVDAAWDSGIVVCAAAGNSGPKPKTINSPGASSKAITVGASDCKGTADISDDKIADFSSRGPTPHQISKPDLAAPGVKINSLATNTKYIPTTNSGPEKQVTYKASSGTSMATPIVAGAVALMLEKNPNLTPREVKEILRNTAVTINENPYSQGKGILNIQAAINSISQQYK